MAVPSAYLTSTKNTAAILDAMQRAAVPDRFTYEFLKQLGFAASGDRPMISVLKSLGFLNDSSNPTPRYRQFKDKSIAKAVLAQGIREGYADVFAIETEANTKTIQEINGIFARLSDKGETVTSRMAMTFKALCGLADFSASVVPDESPPADPENPPPPPPPGDRPPPPPPGVLTLRHDIHVHLPLSTDVAVYDAIFKSLKATLL
jgi:hypothetical protein